MKHFLAIESQIHDFGEVRALGEAFCFYSLNLEAVHIIKDISVMI